MGAGTRSAEVSAGRGQEWGQSAGCSPQAPGRWGQSREPPAGRGGAHPSSPRSPADSQYLTPLVCVGFAALTPACVLIAKQNPPVVRILKFGWFPIVLAMLVSRCAFLSVRCPKTAALWAPSPCMAAGGPLRAEGSAPRAPRSSLTCVPG